MYNFTLIAVETREFSSFSSPYLFHTPLATGCCLRHRPFYLYITSPFFSLIYFSPQSFLPLFPPSLARFNSPPTFASSLISSFYHLVSFPLTIASVQVHFPSSSSSSLHLRYHLLAACSQRCSHESRHSEVKLLYATVPRLNS